MGFSILFAMFVLALIGGAYSRDVRKNRWRRSAWRRAATSLGVSYSGGFFRSETLAGDLQGFSIAVRYMRGSQNGEDRIVFRVSAPAIPRAIKVVPAQHAAIEGARWLSGDHNFDDKFHSSGSDPVLRAVLKRSVRWALASSFEYVSIDDGSVEVHMPQVTDERALVAEAREVIELAHELCLEEGQLAQELYTAFDSELDQAIRAKTFALMLAEAPAALRARAIERGLRHHDPEMVRTALEHSGPQQKAQALEIYRAAVEDQAVRAAALRLLLDAPEPTTSELLALLPGAEAPALRAAIAAALVTREDPAAERAVLGVLPLADVSAGAGEALQREAIVSLMRIGTVEALDDLLAVIAREENTANVRELAREAVRAIQARAPESVRGCLSMAEIEEQPGALSLSKSAGELSVADDPLEHV